MSENKKTESVDWSKGRWKEMLIEQRKYMWSAETIERYSKWIGIKHGMTAVDVGCGLGFLGATYWPHFGEGGKYIGIDQSEDLIKNASEAADEWADGGDAKFVAANAYDLPLGDGSVDWSMCQTLLMHLEHPRKALEEMVRVLKPGGLFSCMEPDNLSGGFTRPFNSALNSTNEEFLLGVRVELAVHDGRVKLGRGDESICNKVPHMLR